MTEQYKTSDDHGKEVFVDPETIDREKQAEESRMDISMSGNNLLVNDELLDATVDLDAVRTALVMGRPVIMAGLEHFKRQQQELHPDAEISLAPFKVINLPDGNMRNVKKSLTAEAIASQEQVLYDKGALKRDLHPLWNVIEESDFIPHTRLYGSRTGWDLAIWAAVRESKDV